MRIAEPIAYEVSERCLVSHGGNRSRVDLLDELLDHCSLVAPSKHFVGIEANLLGDEFKYLGS